MTRLAIAAAEGRARLAERFRAHPAFDIRLTSPTDASWRALWQEAWETRGHPGAATWLARDLRPMLDAARFVRVFNVKTLDAGDFDGEPAIWPTADERGRWLAEYTRRERGGFSVALDAAGVRDDSDFWWWLVRQGGNVVVGLAVRDGSVVGLPDAGTRRDAYLLGPTHTREIATAAALRFVQDACADGSTVCALPQASWQWGPKIAVIAAPERAHALYEDHWRMMSPETAARVESAGPDAVRPTPAAACGTASTLVPDFSGAAFMRELVGDADPAPRLAKALRAAERRVDDGTAVGEGIGAAELVAAVESRPSAGAGTAVLSWAAHRDPLSAELIALARGVAAAVLERSSLPEHWWITEAAREEWRDSMRDLVARLATAERTRAARTRAANARPLEARGEPSPTPERWARREFFAGVPDVAALVDALRARTGVRVFLTGADGRPREVLTGGALAEHYVATGIESKTISEPVDWRRGSRLTLWWPDAAPALASLYEAPPWMPVDTAPASEIPWGVPTLFFGGASEQRQLLSTLSHPTGEECTLLRYQAPGPWRQVDWPLLRRRAKHAIRVLNALAVARTSRNGPVPVLATAAARVRTEGWLLADHDGRTMRYRLD